MTWPAAMQLQAQLLHSGHSWLECWTVPVSDTEALYIVGHTSDVVVGGVTYQAAAIGRGSEVTDSRGGVPSLTLRISNVDRSAQARLEAAGGVLERTLRRLLVNTANLALTVGPSYWEIQDAEASDLEVVCRLGPVSPLEAAFPSRRYQRNRCGLIYGGQRCGYNTTRAGALATCDRTLLGAIGCKVHGDDEEAAGLPRLHTQNFDGEPAIPKGPYL